MKTSLTAALALMALAALTSGAAAAPTTQKPAPAAAKKTTKTVLICPVTGNKIASAKAAYAHETYKGKTYYFCCPECKPRFDKNPNKIIANAAKGKYEKM